MKLSAGKRIIASLWALLMVLVLPTVIFAQQAYPDSLARAWSSTPSWWQLIKVLFFLALILALIWLLLNGLKRLNRRQPGSLKGCKVVTALPLGPRRSLLFVRIGSTIHVLGVTDHHISTVSVISDPAEIAGLGLADQSGRPDLFDSLLKRFGGQPPQSGGS